MSYAPDYHALCGLSVDAADKFGKPCVGAYYAGMGVRDNRLDEDARCLICGARATNSHHEPPLGLGCRNSRLFVAGHRLRPALIALCGSGTTGCHGKVHRGIYRIAWRWDSDDDARDWWQGRMPGESYDYCGSKTLYWHGQWVVTSGGETIKTHREED